MWEELRPRAACHLADGHFDRWYKKQAGRRFRFQLLLDGMLFRGQQLINALPYVSVCLSVVTMFEGGLPCVLRLAKSKVLLQIFEVNPFDLERK